MYPWESVSEIQFYQGKHIICWCISICQYLHEETFCCLAATADDAAAQQYEGRGNRAKALCPGRGDEPAQMCTKQPAKEKAQQGEGAPRPFHHHQSISPGHRLAKLADQGHA